MAWNRTNNNGCPCKDCQDRQPGTGCHDRCEKFQAWRKKLDERNEEERRERNSCDVMSDAKKKAMWKKQNWKRRYGQGRTGPME